MKRSQVQTKKSPALYFLKLCQLETKEKPESYYERAKNEMFKVYEIPFSSPISIEEAIKNHQEDKRGESAAFTRRVPIYKHEERDLDIESEYWKFEQSKQDAKVNEFALMMWGKKFNPFAVRYVELYFMGKTQKTPLVEHLTDNKIADPNIVKMLSLQAQPVGGMMGDDNPWE